VKNFIKLIIMMLFVVSLLFPLALRVYAVFDLKANIVSAKTQNIFSEYCDSENSVVHTLKGIGGDTMYHNVLMSENASEEFREVGDGNFKPIIEGAPLQDLIVNAESLPEATNTMPASTSSAVFVENFEGAFPGDNWWVGDLNSSCGLDYWDDTYYRYHGGSWSGWCAQVGNNSVYGGSNVQQHRYDNYMDAYMVRKYTVDMSSWDVGWVDFYAWYDTESSYDYLCAMWWTGSSWYEDTNYKLSGSNAAWNRYYWRIPDSYLISAGAFGFKFHSDSTVVKEGVYLDDISLWKADITIINYYLNPTSVQPGGTFTAYYDIDNPCPFVLNVGLGLSIRGPDGTIYNDVAHDTVVTVYPFTCTRVSRTFTVPSSAPKGLYDVFWGIWSGFPGQSRWWDGTGWVNDVLTVTGLADLVWTDIWTDPSSPTGGQSARIYWQIKNQGSGDATSTFRNYFYIDGSYVGYGDNNGLAAGSAHNWYLDRTLNPGYHIISAVADVNNNIPESNEGNNEYSEKLWWKGPDLIVVDIWWYDAYGNRDPVITSGQPFTVYFQVKNNGDAAASAFTTYLIVDGWGTAAGSLSGLSPGSTYTWYTENVFVSSLGSHWMKVVVDYFNSVAEANKDTGSGTGTGETNNERVEYFTVQKASLTVLVYFDADNNLEQYEIEDFNQIAQVGSTQSISIAVQMDRVRYPDSKYDDTRYGDWTDCKRFYMKRGITPDPQNAIQSLGEVNMGDSATLSDFIIWGVDRYQAERYLIAINDHGGSWVGCCWDYTNGNDNLDISDIRDAFSTIYSHLGRKVDLVWFDACMGCLMSSIEIAYQISNYVDYMVGSETVGWTSTWDYSSVMAYLRDNPTVTSQNLATAIVNLGNPVDNSTYRTQCISAIDLSRIPNLVSSVNSLAQKMQSVSLTQLMNARRATNWMMGPYDGDEQRIVDLYQLAYNLRAYVSDSDVQSLAQSIMNQIGPSGGAVGYVVMREKHTSSAAFCHGLSIYFPDTKDKYNILYTDGNRFTSDTQWDEFLSYLYNPSVSVTYAPSSPTDADSVSFIVTAGDAYSDLSQVILKWYNGTWYSKTWYVSGGAFSVIYNVGKFAPGTVQYFALVLDQANNIGRDPPSGYKSFTVTDDDVQRPTPSNPSAEPGVVYDNYTGYIRFKVYWSDQSGISDVKFEFWLDSEQFVRSITGRSVDAYGNGWYWYDMPKWEWLKALNHQIVWHCVAWDADNDRANDTTWGDTGIQYGPYVWDDDTTPPSGSNAQPPNGQTYTSDYPSAIRLQVTWTDNTGVASVRIYYRYTSTGWFERSPAQSGNTYYFEIPRSEWTAHLGEEILWYSKAWDSDSDWSGDQLSNEYPSSASPYKIFLVAPAANAYLVVRGLDNGIYYRVYSSATSSWGSWVRLPGSTCDSPAAAVMSNRLHLVVRGLDGISLYHGYVDLSTGAFSGWTKISGSTPSTPTLAS